MTDSAQPAYTIELRQKLTMVQNRYDVVRSDPDGTEHVLAYVEQKRFSLKERVTFYTDDTKQHIAFTIGARNVLELKGSYDIDDGAGVRLGTIRKDFRSSLLRSTYHLDTPQGTITGQERSLVVALIRRVVDVPLPIRFDYHAESGARVMTVDRKLARLRDLYFVRVFDPALDWRLAAVQAVAQDAFMNR